MLYGRSDRSQRAQEAKARLHAYLLMHPCVDCGETSVATLDFDHIDPSTKIKAIGEMIGHRPWHSIQRDIEKCEVRCASHRRRTIRHARAA